VVQKDPVQQCEIYYSKTDIDMSHSIALKYEYAHETF